MIGLCPIARRAGSEIANAATPTAMPATQSHAATKDEAADTGARGAERQADGNPAGARADGERSW